MLFFPHMKFLCTIGGIIMYTPSIMCLTHVIPMVHLGVPDSIALLN